MAEFKMFLDGWKLLILRMPTGGKYLFVIACFISTLLGVYVGLHPSIAWIRGTETTCVDDNNVTYYTSGKVVAPYQKAFDVRGNFVLEFYSPGQCHTFEIPKHVTWIYVRSGSH